MSATIHGYAEVLRVGYWALGRPMKDDPDWEPGRLEPVDEFTRAGIGPQNSALFTMLAPFRGQTFEDLTPLTRGRGLPADLCPELAALIDQYFDWEEGSASKSHTWVLLRELLEFDWSGFERHYGEPLQRRLIDSLSELGDPDSVRLVCWVGL